MMLCMVMLLRNQKPIMSHFSFKNLMILVLLFGGFVYPFMGEMISSGESSENSGLHWILKTMSEWFGTMLIRYSWTKYLLFTYLVFLQNLLIPIIISLSPWVTHSIWRTKDVDSTGIPLAIVCWNMLL